jgi:hypothetical protein
MVEGWAAHKARNLTDISNWIVWNCGVQPRILVLPDGAENILRNHLNLEPVLVLALNEDSSRN